MIYSFKRNDVPSPTNREKDDNLKTRVLSAIVMIVLSLICIPFASVPRVLYFAVLGGLCAYEYSKNVEKLDARCTLWVMLVYLGGQTVLTLLDAGLFAYVACFVFCIYLALFSGVLHKEVAGRGALYTLAGLTYPCLLCSVIIVISVTELWWQTLLIACVATLSCDSFALFGGTRFGRHKVAPLVSPNKSVEGCICGAAASLVFGALVFLCIRRFYPLPLRLCLVTSLAASTMGQIGDLAESLLKRMIGVMDFSNLIPGHGGVFDRVDSLLFSIPTTYFCLLLAEI